MPKSLPPGFTLIEMSIVLVVIGLVVGGILVGRDLVQAAAIRSVISDIEKFKTAVNTFRVKYDCLPGDCPNATTFFGASTQCASRAASLTPGTCNGNGNGLIIDDGYYTSEPAGPAPSYAWYAAEDVLFWNHLSLAGLVPGNFSGTNPAFTVSAPSVPFSNSIPGACYYVVFSGYDPQYPDPQYFPQAAGNRIHFGSPVTPQPGSIGYGCSYAIITPGAAFSIDSKIDDGSPMTGTVATEGFVVSASGGTMWNPCLAGSGPYQYAVSTEAPVCDLTFQGGF